MTYVSRPVVLVPEHRITVGEIQADLARLPLPPNRRAALLRLAAAAGVEYRYFTRPLAEVAQTLPYTERNDRAFADLALLGERAARRLLAEHGIAPEQVDAVITSHSTGCAIPGLDVHLVNALGLRPDVRRLPVTQLGCAGGAFALVRADELVRARPGTTVLVVVAEALSSVYQQSDHSPESAIYKGLFGDSGSAVLVTGEPLGPGLAIEDTWEYLLPDTTDRYRLRIEADGYHFDSTRAALESTGELIPPLRKWYGEQTPGFVVAHPGGPRILEDLERHLHGDGSLLHHSWETLRDRGNLGGAAVLDVLVRLHDDPPSDGTEGLLLGLGPGFTAAACRVSWHARDHQHDPSHSQDQGEAIHGAGSGSR